MNKITEWCPWCEHEVDIDAIKCKLQKCPVCGKPIRACSMCVLDNDENKCVKCEEENK